MALITSTGNAAVRDARKLAARPRSSRGDDRFLVEGPQAVGEAIGRLDRLFVTVAARDQRQDLVIRARAAGAEVLEVTEPVLASIAGTVTPQGLVGVAALPPVALEAVLAQATLIVVLVEVRDPGNAGTIVRTADAAGADVVVFTPDSVDPRTPKAVRASAGSLFHLPIVDGVDVGILAGACQQRGIQMVATTPRATTDYDAVDLERPSALVFGNEARGLPLDVVERCDVAVRVPLHGRAESLNLAATVAVLAYEAARQRRHARSDAR